ncbi:MAG: peptidoglycan editing factor PgeF, partial [Cyanobacteria bacterium J06632_22]
MQNWTWQDWQGSPYLTCDLMNRWPHGFFTRHFAPARPPELVQVLAAEATAFRTQQVHGNVVLDPDAIATLSTDDQFAQADGCYSTAPQQAMWTCTADCTPALIGDVRTGHVAAVHAGWRGTAQRIIPVAIEKMQAQSSRLADLRVALGPAIDGAVYQVGSDVAAETGRSVFADQFDDHTALLDHLQTLQPPAVLADDEPERVRLDVRQVNRLQLLHLGVNEAHIAIAPHCTYQEPEQFFS